MRSFGGAGTDPRAARWIRIRVFLLVGLLGAGFATVAGRAFYLQVLRRDELASEAVDQYLREVELKPRRGVVTDRAGVLLAGSADATSVYADPQLLAKRDDAAVIVRRVGQILKVDPRGLQKKLGRGGRFAWLERRVPPAEATALQAFLAERRVDAIRLVPETRRYYPKLELAGQLLGVVDDDGAGREGVELAFDDVLQGSREKVPSLRDGRGRVVLAAAPNPGHAREGARVELTVDHALQAVVEKSLARAVTGSRALSGMVVALEPRTGDILALASYPVANANAARSGDQIRDRPITDAFEPGSTVKTFSMATALDAGALSPRDAIDCGERTFKIGTHTIHDHEAVGWAGPAQILARSSNIGAAKIAAKLGRERLQAGLQRFGFGDRSGVDLPGEVRSQLPFPRAEITLATQSFGQGLTANALQITNAMAVFANGGELVRPQILRRVVDPATGEELDRTVPEVVGRAVSAATAATVTRWLVGVIEDPRGTGKRARLDGWSAAGKTGTAQKADKVVGYAHDRHFSSFVGFAPAEAPRIVIGVFIDEPKGEIYGGEVAAPAFKEIAEHALRTMGVAPTEPRPGAAELAAAVPVAGGTTLADATLEPDEEPPPAVEWADHGRDGRVTVPALAGLPARAAIRRLEDHDLGAELQGSGRVVGQAPAPGRAVERGTRVRVTLAPAG